MASSSKLFLSLALLLFSFASNSFAAAFECDELPINSCAFAVSSSHSRCVLETNVMTDGRIEFECQTSKVLTDTFSSWIETAECINSCGLSRTFIGLSTDFVEEHELHQTICSQECQNNCPNIVDLFTNLAAGEGISLRGLCEAERIRSRKLVQTKLWEAGLAAAVTPAPVLSPLP